MTMASAVTFRAVGFKAMQAKLDRKAAVMTGQAVRFLEAESNRIMTKAKQMTPVGQQTSDRRRITGDLRDSGTVDPVEHVMGTGVITVRLHFGQDKAQAYALAVHETPSAHDPPSWRGKSVTFRRGGAKYLELPLMEAANTMGGRLAGRMKL